MSAAEAPRRGGRDEPGRLAAVARVRQQHARVRDAMNRWAKLLARLVGAPVAQVNLVTATEEVPLGSTGGAEWAEPVGLEWSFCQHVVASGEPMIVADARTHPLLAENLGTTEAGIVAYASAPLTLADGETIGSLCAVDFHPRTWRQEEVDLLLDLAGAVVAELERDAAEQALRESEARYRRTVRQAEAERQRLEAVLASISDAFFALDREWRFTYVNDRAEEVLQRRRAELLGHSIWQEFPPAVGTVFHEQYQRALRTGETVAFEAFYPPLDVWFEVRAYPGPEGLAVYFQDVSERRRVARALAESEARFRTVQAASQDGFQLCESIRDAGGRVKDFVYRYLNPAGLRLVGRTEAEMLGHRMLEVFPGLKDDALFRAYIRVAETGEPMQQEVVYTRDGLDGGFRVSVVQVAGGIALSFSDITARLHAEAALAEREADFRALADNIPQLAWMADAEGALYWYNRRWYSYTGLSPAASLGDGWRQVHHPEHLAGVEARFRQAIRTGDLWEDTFPLRGADGEYRWFLSRAVPIRDAQGRIIRWFGTNTDVTEERRRETTLRVSEQRYALAARATHNAIWEWDLLTHNLTWSPGVYEVFGYAPGTVPRGIQWWYDTIHPADRERVVAGIHQVIDWQPGEPGDGQSWKTHYRFRRADGSYAVVSDRGYVERGHGGRALRMIGAMADVTREQEAEAERERLLEAERAARAEAEEANRAKMEFLSAMSHELRTPLNAIAGYVDLMELGIHGPITEAQRQALGRIQHSQQHLLRLINDVLNFAKLEAGRVHYDIQPLPGGDVLRDVVALIEPQVVAQHHTLRLHLPEQRGEPPILLLADREKLVQVLLNLLSNAAKFTPPGGTITVAVQADGGGWAEVSVSDTGIGIAPEKQEAVFDPFVQVNASLTRTHEGTGLGLAISRDLARGMGGDLSVHSAPGQGSTFTLRLRAGPEARA